MLLKRFFVPVVAAMTIASNAQADAVLDWNLIMQDTLSGPAMLESRNAASTQLAVFEAVNAITREYRPYIGTIQASSAASPDAAAIAAAHTVLRAYAPAKAAQLDAARVQSLSAIVDGPRKSEGIAVGEAAAAAVLSLRANDGATPVQSYLPTETTPGAWQLTVGCPATGGAYAHWGNVQPFGVDNIAHFDLPPPPALNSRRYEQSYNEVERVGARNSVYRPQDRADVARYYAVVLTIRTWNPIARQIAVAQSRSLTHNARSLALLNMAMNDALVAVFRSKYEYTRWRPETAIRNGDNDGNSRTAGDATFEPFVSTPCHPSYGSAHASAGYAARAVLERVYGRRGHAFELSSASVPGITLQYNSIQKVTSDIDDARVYGGIHFRYDQEAGAKLGSHIGRAVYWKNLQRNHWSQKSRHLIDSNEADSELADTDFADEQ
jgi:PAP2 superfamily